MEKKCVQYSQAAQYLKELCAAVLLQKLRLSVDCHTKILSGVGGAVFSCILTPVQVRERHRYEAT